MTIEGLAVLIGIKPGGRLVGRVVDATGVEAPGVVDVDQTLVVAVDVAEQVRFEPPVVGPGGLVRLDVSDDVRGSLEAAAARHHKDYGYRPRPGSRLIIKPGRGGTPTTYRFTRGSDDVSRQE